MEYDVFADLVDPNDLQGRSHREINREKQHNIPINALVELESGARAFVVKHTRDCDQTPLYSLAIDPDPEAHKFSMCHGYDEESIKVVRWEYVALNAKVKLSPHEL